MYLITPIRGTHILLPQLIIQTASFIHDGFHLKLFCGTVTYFSTHASSFRFFQVSSIIIFNGRRLNHKKLLKIFLGVLIWLMIHRCIIGTQHLIAHFPCILQWLIDSMVLAKIVTEGLIRLHSYFIKVFVASKLMTPISYGNRTNPSIAKATSLYRSSPNLPSSTFFFIWASMIFHLNPPLATPHRLIFPKHNNLTTFEVVSSNFLLI